MNKKRPYFFESEFSQESDGEIFGQHSEPHPFRLLSKEPKPKKLSKTQNKPSENE